jgi:RHS repeat-associated protein
MSHHSRTLFFSLSLVLMGISTANAAQPKFHAAIGAEPVIGRYIVTLDSSVAEQLARVSAESLAHAYGGQLELYSSSDVRQFAIVLLPSRARTLSADPRVREVVEIAQSDPMTTAAPPSPRVIERPAGASLVRHLAPGALDSSSTGNYAYDGAGNITTIGADSFDYDVEGRLMHATVQGNLQSYTYDAFGNRTGTTRASNAVGCVGGCEATVTVDHQTNHVAEQTYDEAGNVVSGFTAAYKYDGTGMVTEATVGSDIRDFVYTADDERIAVRRGATWTWTVRDHGNKVLREFTSLETSPSPLTLTTHTWSKDYVWRDGLLLASVFPTSPGSSSTTTYHYHLDHLGTPHFVTDGSHVKVAEHVYYPFGAEMNITPHEGAVELMKFTGHERDIVAADNATVDYMHARYYNGNLGRFLEVDPVISTHAPSQPQQWNRYSYALNRPTTFTDPAGQTIYNQLAPSDTDALFSRLRDDTGLDLALDEHGVWKSNGVLKDENGNDRGSATARADLLAAMAPGSTHIVQSDSHVWMGITHGALIKLNFADIGRIRPGRNDSRTLDAATIFLHELWGHSMRQLPDFPGQDNSNFSFIHANPTWKGPVVEHDNIIRRELGLPTRSQYRTESDNRGTYLPFANGPIYLPEDHH